MISKDIAKFQLSRLAQMDRYPKGEVGALGELLKEIMKADNEEIAEKAIGSFVDEADLESRCPMPKMIRERLAQVANEMLGKIREDPDCPLCHGIGHVPHVDANGCSYVTKCTCYARRPAPDYSRRGATPFAGMQEDIARVAAAKRIPAGEKR